MIKKHLLLTLGGVENKEALRYSVVLKECLTQIMNDMEMTIVGKSSHQFIPCGATVVILLAESHCSAHTFVDEKEIFVDLFCCRNFNVNGALDLFVQHFQPQNVHFQLVDRVSPTGSSS
jgi:S-adenosylmethionine decarboxylase